MWAALKVFVAGFVIDFAYVGWMKSVEAHQPIQAGLFSVLVAACGLFAVFEAFKQKKMVIPYLAGLFFGTVCSMAILT